MYFQNIREFLDVPTEKKKVEKIKLFLRDENK